MCKHRKVVIFNNFFKVNNFSEYNIDYSYYIGEAYRFLYKISGQINNSHRVTSSKKRISGSLFDELDEFNEFNNKETMNECQNCIFAIVKDSSTTCYNEDSKFYLNEVDTKCNDYVQSNEEDDDDNDD